MAKRKVLLLLHTLNLTGAPKIALDAFEQLQDEVELQIITIRGGAWEDRCRRLGPLAILERLPQGNAPWQRARRIAAKAIWARRWQNWQPDVIYINSVAALPLANNLRLPQSPALLHVHELKSITEQFAGDCLELLAHWPQRYLAVSSAVVKSLVENYRVAAQNIALVHEFVPDADFERTAALLSKPSTNGDGRRFVVGGAGYPSWRKGPLLWLQMAVELVKLLGRDVVRFVWVGVTENEEGAVFREMARKLGLDDVIEWVAVTPEPLPQLARCDVFAMTSWEDPCPIVVLEAMMLQKPVVCFAHSGGAPEEVGDAGCAVADFSPLLMAQQLAAWYAEPAKVAAMGQRARRRVQNQFIASVQTPKILAEIDRLITAKP